METGTCGSTIITLTRKTYRDIINGKFDIKIATTNGVLLVNVIDDDEKTEDTDIKEDNAESESAFNDEFQDAYDDGFNDGYDAGYADGYLKAKKEARRNG